MPTLSTTQQAILYIVLAALCFTLVNSAIRFVDHLPTFELVFFRALGSAIFGFSILKWRKIPLLGNNKSILLLRGLVGFIAMSLFFKAFQMMPMGSAVSLRYLSPFFAAGLALILLKEKMQSIQWLFFATAFAGVVLLKGFDSRISLLGLAIILASAILSGLVYVIIRKIGTSENPIVIVNYFMWIAMLGGGFFSLFNWVNPVGIEWLLLLSMGLFGFGAQLFMTKGLQIAATNLVTPFKYVEVIFTLFAGWLFFQEDQSWLALLGMGIIIASLIANVLVVEYAK